MGKKLWAGLNEIRGVNVNNLTEKDFASEKEEVLNGRFTMSGMRVFLIGVLFYSGFLVGLSFAIANANTNTVGWNTLSRFWQVLFYVEVVSFGFLALVLVFCWGKTGLNQKLLIVATVLCSYKIALEPFLMILMFSKDGGTYDSFFPLVLLVIISGLFLHIYFFYRWIKGLKRGRLREENSKKTSGKSRVMVPIIFILATVTGIVTKRSLS